MAFVMLLANAKGVPDFQNLRERKIMKALTHIMLLALAVTGFAGSDSTAPKRPVAPEVIPNPNPSQWLFMETAEPLPRGWWGVKVPFPLPFKTFSASGITVNYQLLRWMQLDAFKYGLSVVDSATSNVTSVDYGWVGAKFNHNRFKLGSGSLYLASGLRLWGFGLKMMSSSDSTILHEPFAALLLYTTATWHWKNLRVHTQLMLQPGDKKKNSYSNFFFTPGLDVELGKRVTLFLEYWYSPFAFALGDNYSGLGLEIPPEYNPERKVIGLGWIGSRVRIWRGSYVDLGVLLVGGAPSVPLPIISFGINWSKWRDACCAF
jgi:hypothetical protein